MELFRFMTELYSLLILLPLPSLNYYSSYPYYTITMPSFIEIKARKAQREAEHIQLQQEEEADLREQERLEKKEEERLEKEAEEARLEEVRRQEEAREVVRCRKAQKEAEARARAKEASSDEVGSVSGTIHIRRKRVMAVGELDMSRKVVGMDGLEWFPKIGVSCLRFGVNQLVLDLRQSVLGSVAAVFNRCF